MASDLNIARHGPQDGPPILLIHGAWHGAWCWDGLAPLLAAAGFRVLAPDLRGHGESPGRKHLRWTGIRQHVRDISALITGLDQPPIVIAHSMGGFIAQHLMARGVPMRGVAMLAALPHTGALPIALKTLWHHPRTFARILTRLSLYPMVADPADAARLFLDPATPAPEANRFHAKLQDESFRAFLDMVALALPGKPARPYPALVLAGADDALFPPKAEQRLARRLATTAQVLPGAPHDLMLSPHTETTARHILDWAATLPPGAKPPATAQTAPQT
ncbi:alpha/beta hydrolase [Rhodalgimonas zhirmunskyi]|uniref:Lysophospholipase n=1 Tax=Rhodalgimonas zhirmunskyi TaxID=2964767 RepID=A0AAJ1U5F4_9RHOB|nr:alpha/beta fold hydrolase [Rhodoalgimonas zhirmunskyi]MDQ2093946.1 lysophospholipase [Rhodoalgimonas zhirmunskyi]